MVQHILDTFDRNHDGKISYAEFERLFRRVAEKISRYRRAEHGTGEVEKMKEKDVVYSKHTQKRRDLCVHLVDGTRRVFSAMQNCVASIGSGGACPELLVGGNLLFEAGQLQLACHHTRPAGQPTRPHPHLCPDAHRQPSPNPRNQLPASSVSARGCW